MLKQNEIDTIIRICKEAGIDYLALFGSYARGDYTKDSDVDLLVNFKETQSYFEKARVLLDIQDNINKEVDLISYKNIKPNRKAYIMKDAITIYDER